jgi:hypothetical protein
VEIGKKFLTLLLFPIFIYGCGDSSYKHPRNEFLLEVTPEETRKKMDDYSVPRDTQIALVTRFNSALCEVIGDDLGSKSDVLYNSYEDVHRRAVMLISLGWETSEGYIAKKWTAFPFISQLWFPLEFLRCGDKVKQWQKRYGKG